MSNSALDIPDHALGESFSTHIGMLGLDGESFVFCDLEPFIGDQQTAIEALCINSTSVYNNYGDAKNLFSEVEEFFKSLGNSVETSHTIAALVQYLTTEAVYASKKEEAWVAIRSWSADIKDNFSIPRWHTDGKFFSHNDDALQYKFALALKGPQTMFYNITDEERSNFNAIQGNVKVVYKAGGEIDFEAMKKATEDNRPILAKMLNNEDLIKKAKLGQAAMFVVGSDKAAVHSEPIMDHEERLFLSIVTGTKVEIQEWCKASTKK